MNNAKSVKVVGYTASIFLVISYLICIGFDLLFPQHAMYTVWENLLPGFEWLNWKGFIIGLVEVFAYGWYIAIIWVPLHNFFNAKFATD